MPENVEPHVGADPSALTLATIAKDVAALRGLIFATMDERQMRMDERTSAQMLAVDKALAGQEKAVSAALAAAEALLVSRDVRNEQRFIAQEKAIDLALTRVDKEFHEHLNAVREENRLAMSNADKAISKSEASTEKRFEGVNEFRQQLGDQAATFMPRLEAEQRAGQNTEKIAELEKRMIDALATVNSRLDRNQGTTEGVDVVARLTAIQRQINDNTLSIQDGQRGSAAVAGRSQGLNDAWKYLIGALALLPILVAVVVYATAQNGP